MAKAISHENEMEEKGLVSDQEQVKQVGQERTQQRTPGSSMGVLESLLPPPGPCSHHPSLGSVWPKRTVGAPRGGCADSTKGRRSPGGWGPQGAGAAAAVGGSPGGMAQRTWEPQGRGGAEESGSERQGQVPARAGEPTFPSELAAPRA